MLPVHNGMPYVEAGIRAILAQSFADFELIVGDDGSTDGTTAVLTRLADTDARIRILTRSEKSGLAASENWVIAAARAPLIAIAHADDLSAPDRLQRQVAVMADPSIVLVGAMAEGIDERGRVVHPPNLWRLHRPSAFAAFAHSLTMVRRAAFDAVGGYRPEAEYWEDLDLSWRLSAVGRAVVIPAVLGQYRHSAVSVRRRDDPSALENAFERAYRAAPLAAAGQDYDTVFEHPNPARVTARIFVARSWIWVWVGRRAQLIGRMVERARFRFDRETAVAVTFVLWASIAPRSLRAIIQGVTILRNRTVAKHLMQSDYIEWQPRARPQQTPTLNGRTGSA